jgi:hypothetical protein
MASITEKGADLFIRPERAKYKIEELGPQTFTFACRKYERQDLEVGLPSCLNQIPISTSQLTWLSSLIAGA